MNLKKSNQESDRMFMLYHWNNFGPYQQ